jgi:HAD superfamily hydrolase (TIGR01458 family)
MIRGVLLDLSGVLYIGDEPVSGAVDAVKRLSGAGLSMRYITNTTRSTRQMILKRLTRLGFDIAAEDVFTAPIASKQYIETNNLIPYLLIHPNLEPEFSDITGEPNAVLVGDAGDRFNYDNMNKAFRYLLDGAILLAMGVNRYFKDGNQFSLDAGPFVHALEYASNTKAIVLGKPSYEFYSTAVKSLGCSPEDAVMVGDDVEADVIGAVNVGLNGILVRTGKYIPDDEKKINNKATCVADISAAVDQILEQT